MTTKRILNGIVGDYLDGTGNELATEMALYQNDGLQVQRFSTNKSLCILVHGLVDDESVWLKDDVNYGENMRRDLELVPLYLRYNSGLHVSTNGKKLNSLLQSLSSPGSPAREIVFLCHSMGGLVVRSACSYGLEQDAVWTKRVSHVIFLGTPHQGSYWEKAGNILTNSLDFIPRPYMKLAAQVGNLRSDGIKDLRYGYVRDEDWNNGDQDALLNNTKTKSNLLSWASYHVVTGTITKNPNNFLSQMFGDALVHKLSAQGHSENDDHHLPFVDEDFCEFPGIHHQKLTSDISIYEKIREWISQPCAPPVLPDKPDLVTLDCDDLAEETVHAASSRGSYDDCKGGSKLVHESIHAGVTAVGKVQRELTSEVYSILSKFCLIAPVVKKVQVVHEASVDAVYASILAVNSASATIAGFAIEEVKKRRQEDGTTVVTYE
uniref:GPI inositol-deacylase n=1 Tax=Amphora coffeiformis TaxID=265554 RepID=A0A7S3P9Q0_9STRA|mmetsp:Transcript_1969/g.4309  ORF Transcript_1969/g.4309 Transcript_1969/m.4309 type:complete len:435 (+) Transcript_1969:65-1369(+)|eukprot:scaffold11639_cov172-Amphora_coffeaeformis.AAC.20